MHTTHSNTPYKNESNHSEMGPVRQNPIQTTVRSVHIMCVLCTTVTHNIAQNRPDNFSPYRLDNHHCSDDVYLREGGWAESITCYMGGPDLSWEGAILVDRGAHCKVQELSAVSYAKTAKPIHLPFRLWTRVGRRMHKFNRIRQVAPMCHCGRTRRCHLSNNIEPSVYGGDAPYGKLL